MLDDGCTAGPLSAWLNSTVGQCCMAHDAALDRGFSLGAFWSANIELARCVSHSSPLLALVVFAAVSSPVGLMLYRFGPKRK